ncbi:MAG: AAA domain-containing protein [Acidimicrobiaceae bacterium]|nr:AAA domain-containing protein [Acidimicrobiaceae bacterium]
MAKLTKILRGTDPVSETEANQVFELLVPVVERSPGADDALDAAAGVIGRCPLSKDRPLAHVLDWWFVVTTGRASANGGAHRLPESIDERARGPMAAVAQLSATVPAAEWLDKQRQLDLRLKGIDNDLSPDAYGAVKVPGERDAWKWFIDQWRPATERLRNGCRAEIIEIDWRRLETELRAGSVEGGSKRFRELQKRCREADNRLRATVHLQHAVEPWTGQRSPDLIGEVPSSVRYAVGHLVEALLRPILSASAAAPEVNGANLAVGLEAHARGGDARGRYRLARVVSDWCEETGKDIPSLQEEMQRHRALTAALELLGTKPEVTDDGIDEVRLAVLEDDLEAAEEALARLREQVERAERAGQARAQFEGLRRKLNESVLSDDDAWKERLDDIRARMETGDPRELAAEIGTAQRSLGEALDKMVENQQENLRELTEPLRILGAPDARVRDFERRIDALEQRGGRGAGGLKHELENALAELRSQRRADIQGSLAEIDRILTTEREDFSDDDLGLFLNRRSEIEALSQTEGTSDRDLAESLEVAEDLQREVEDHRIYRWRADEGEDALLEHILESCRGALDFDPLDVKRLYVSLKTRPFAILAGLTGSGKSSLTRTFAAALGATTANRRFRRVAVRPDWIDQSEVLGYVSPVSDQFVPGWLSETVRDCEHAPDRLHFVLLDEMNLAPVEQYLAEWLSALEEARSGSEDVRLRLYSPDLAPKNRDDWPPQMVLPDNLVIVGTVNVDETTRPLSERVLDRANVLLLNVEISNSHHESNGSPPPPWHVGMTEWTSVCATEPSDKHHDFLVEVAHILRESNIGVGLRAHLELERFVANAEQILDPETALDWGIVQRIIPKIRGFKGHLVGTLGELLEEFEAVGAEQSASVIRRWLDERVSDDEFMDGTDPRLALARI